MSVGASAGIVLLGPTLLRAIPGPRPLAAALAVTAAAQAGVAPVLIPVFGGLPVAALPANLLAVPAAGPVMVWGLAGGLPAGLAGGWPARLVHVPTGLLVAWIARVAQLAAALPLGSLGMGHVVALAGLAVLAARVGHGPVRRVASIAVVAVLLSPAFVRHHAGEVAPGAELRRHGGRTTLVLGGADPVALLGGLRVAGVRDIDEVVVRPGRAADAALAALERRHRVGRVRVSYAKDGRSG